MQVVRILSCQGIYGSAVGGDMKSNSIAPNHVNCIFVCKPRRVPSRDLCVVSIPNPLQVQDWLLYPCAHLCCVIKWDKYQDCLTGLRLPLKDQGAAQPCVTWDGAQCTPFYCTGFKQRDAFDLSLAHISSRVVRTQNAVELSHLCDRRSNKKNEPDRIGQTGFQDIHLPTGFSWRWA